jgi:ATP-binding cassette subfamily B multidrug efflux pump
VNILKRIVHFVKPYTRESILALVMLCCVVASDLATPRLVQRLVDQGITPRNMTVIWTTALLMIGVEIVSALMTIGNTFMAVRVSQSFAADVRSALFHKVQTLSFGNLDRLQTGQLMIRLTSDISLVQSMVTMSLRLMTRAPLLMLGSATLLILTSPKLALLMAVLLPITLAVLWFFVSQTQPLFMQVQRKLGWLNQVLQENLAGVRVVKAFVRADYENTRFGAANDDLMNQTIRVQRILSMLQPTMTFLINLGTASVIWFGGNMAIHGSITVGQIMAFVNYLLTTLFPLGMLGNLATQFPQARASAVRIIEVLDNVPEVQDRPDAWTLTEAQGRVAFEDVCLHYNHASAEPVLQNVNLVAEPGQTVAVLGATGSGKSSLVHLIPRFYDVERGRVTIDGVDVRQVAQGSLRAHIGIAMQEAVLFSGTIRDNIRYGRPDAGDEEVIAAARAAQAHDFIMSLPGGYDAPVTQRGANLSGGQKQRLAIARALLIQPRILILDDSTSAVDVETEARIQEALEQVMADCTAFVIAQRISTALTADKIVILDRGRVVAEGTHAELLASSPIYQDIYASQLGDGGGNHD